MGVEFLVSNGHPPTQVLHYTLKQFRAYLTLAWTRVTSETYTVALVTRMAYHAGEDDFKEFKDDLIGD